MPSIKRIRNIRLNELKQLYYRMLQERAAVAWQDEIAAGIVLQCDLEEDLLAYYRRTVASVQEFYSRYSAEWETYAASETLPAGEFFGFLEPYVPTFRKRYELTELNVEYYLQCWRQSPDAEGELLKELFLDKWYRVLSDKEFHYQYHHLGLLCDGCELLHRKKGLKTDRGKGAARIEWLMRNFPQLHERILPYQKEMERHPAIRQLVEVLGRKKRGRKRSFDACSGISSRWLLQHSACSDIEGVTVGNDLGRLLPVEYCYMADDDLLPFFLQRYAEKQLQQFDGYSKEQVAVRNRRKQEAGQGPFIVCVDTSASMQGDRERTVKSAILAIALLTGQTGRKCYVINFSDEAVALKISDLASEFHLLDAFLNRHFDGGTDIAPALREALRVVRAEHFHESDVVLISDFEMPPISDELRTVTDDLKTYHTRFYALSLGSRAERDYLSLCEQYWEL